MTRQEGLWYYCNHTSQLVPYFIRGKKNLESEVQCMFVLLYLCIGANLYTFQYTRLSKALQQTDISSFHKIERYQ